MPCHVMSLSYVYWSLEGLTHSLQLATRRNRALGWRSRFSISARWYTIVSDAMSDADTDYPACGRAGEEQGKLVR